MSHLRSKSLPFILLVVTLASLVFPGKVLAAISVLSVTPGTVVNSTSTDVTVGGGGFASGAVVSLNGYGNLATTFINDTSLTATVPAGVPVGTYTVTVTNPDTSTASLSNGLIVQAPTATPTSTPSPTATSTFGRPQVAVRSYRSSVGTVQFGQDFDLSVTLENAGQFTAANVQAVFAPGDVIPRSTGGVVVAGTMTPAGQVTITQPMTAMVNLWGKTVIAVDMTLTYYDLNGNAFTEKFTLSIPLRQPSVSAATPTPSTINRPQLVITNYETSAIPLQPGYDFELKLTVRNVGNANARRVVMIVGGGGSGSGGDGTPQPGGIPGGSGEFSNFAPLGASNVQSLGDLDVSGSLDVSQPLIVNVSANPGAYPMRITFSYLDEKGNSINDDQVITLLVYSLPSVDINFYRVPDPFYAGQPGALPIQLVNLGRKSTVLGTMRVETTDGSSTIENGQILIGAIEPGGYFPLDALLFPSMAGQVTLKIVVDYTDDFNQPRQIIRELVVDVQEPMIEPDPGFNGGGGPVQPPETFWQKIWRFILGLFGLDSSAPSQPGEGGIEEPIVPDGQPIPGPGPKG